ncbi:vacuolar membrane protein protein [Babesia ovis]|uniref:Vacuolar membrane protein protein n=1 Tax=Babesia ovis TaxID=5869 RepID=A0A9W5WUC4_BABOV|nr:vacuolar membrane protein protein [Babesia ovis]
MPLLSPSRSSMVSNIGAAVSVTQPMAAAGSATSIPNAIPLSVSLNDSDRCTLIPGVFGLSIQLVLCIISITVVFLKYAFENPKRPPLVFLMDFVTMMCGSGTVHILNIISSILIQRFQSGSDIGDECNIYFMTTLFDSTFGIYIEYRIVRYMAIRKEAQHYLELTRKSVFNPTTEELADATRIASAALSKGVPVEGYAGDLEGHTGERGNDIAGFGGMEHETGQGNRWKQLLRVVTDSGQWLRTMSNKKFLENLMSWLAIVCGLKVFSITLFTIFPGTVNAVGEFLLGFLHDQQTMKLLFVMIGAPLVLNVFQYCITDSIIKIKSVERSRAAEEG